jgi:flagellar basal body-associated protein FliL
LSETSLPLTRRKVERRAKVKSVVFIVIVVVVVVVAVVGGAQPVFN